MPARSDAPAHAEGGRRSGSGGDQVEAVRDWLRERGVDPGPSPRSATGGSIGRSPTRRSDERSSDMGTPDADQPGIRGFDAGAEPDESPRGQTRARRSAGDQACGTRSPRDSRAPGRSSGLGGSRGPSGSSDLDPDADPEEVARQIVLRKLAVQARTRVELERALAKKAVPDEAAAAVLDRMGEVGLVDDATFARDWVASRQQRRHLSRSALRRELQTKGVDRETIDDALTEVDGADEYDAALDLATRRVATMSGVSREAAYRRLGGMLARRGFSSSVTARVLSEVLDVHADD